jgi:hypothetical protein
MQMSDQPLHHISQSRIRPLRIDYNRILCYIVNIKVLHWRRFALFGVHVGVLYEVLGELEAEVEAYLRLLIAGLRRCLFLP